MIISPSELKSFLEATNAQPHSFLGMHPARKGKTAGLVVRAFLKDAVRCEVVEVTPAPAPSAPAGRSKARRGGKKSAAAKTASATTSAAPAVAAPAAHEMEQIAPEGFFELFLPRRDFFRYQLRATYANGHIFQVFDPYSFLPTLGEQDLYLFNEGNEHRIYEKLGAHPRVIDGVAGVSFAVWAPSARRVSVVGNFNQWDGRSCPMRSLGASGVWELFLPSLGEGELYKYEIFDQAGNIRIKTDPYGTRFEAPPGNASIVCNPCKHAWGDDAWLARRREQAADPDRAISIYEVHLGSWKRKVEDGDRVFSYRELAPQLADYALEHGFTHIEVMPVAEHPFDGSWGYQVTGFYAPTQRYGTPEDFAFFVDHLHQRGLGIIVDWVPAHFPRDAFALAEFDGTHLYEHSDPRQGAHMDWGTLIFNYGRHEVRCFLIANALSWFDRYHIDGLRVDAVASMLYLDYSRKEGEWIPNKFGGRENLDAIDFLRETNRLVHEYYPGALMIAEESTAFAGISKPVAEGGIGFDFKWNMGWMHDTLSFFEKDPVHRRWHHNELTFGALYQYSEKFVTVFSHDEVVHGKGSLLMKMGAGDIPGKAANLRALYGHMWTWPGKKLLFMGGEFGQSSEWAYARQLDWHLLQYLDHDGIRLLVRDLNRLYRDEPALHATDLTSKGFRWIAGDDAAASVIAFLRISPDGKTKLAVVGHFTPLVREGYRIGVPHGGWWQEIMNTNSAWYGGTGLGNDGGKHAQPVAAHGFDESLLLTLPPMSVTVFRHAGD
ncbi:glycogen branching protein [Opitutaceae bacterium TAV5]|nr:glycogen branching protein [Opitutaceae bacterium TAV5]